MCASASTSMVGGERTVTGDVRVCGYLSIQLCSGRNLIL